MINIFRILVPATLVLFVSCTSSINVIINDDMAVAHKNIKLDKYVVYVDDSVKVRMHAITHVASLLMVDIGLCSQGSDEYMIDSKTIEFCDKYLRSTYYWNVRPNLGFTKNITFDNCPEYSFKQYCFSSKISLYVPSYLKISNWAALTGRGNDPYRLSFNICRADSSLYKNLTCYLVKSENENGLLFSIDTLLSNTWNSSIKFSHSDENVLCANRMFRKYNCALISKLINKSGDFGTHPDIILDSVVIKCVNSKSRHSFLDFQVNSDGDEKIFICDNICLPVDDDMFEFRLYIRLVGYNKPTTNFILKYPILAIPFVN